MGTETATVAGSNVLVDGPKGRNLRLVKSLLIETGTVAQGSDTCAFDLAGYGGTAILGVSACVHTTLNNVVIAEAGTGAISGTTVTLTCGTGNNGKVRTFEVFFT
jgi:hypothetical protein